jgi:CheY-like chemotaxis protein
MLGTEEKAGANFAQSFTRYNEHSSAARPISCEFEKAPPVADSAFKRTAQPTPGTFQEPLARAGCVGMAILIVEDDSNSRQGLKLSLAAEGYHVEAVGDGLQAIKAALNQRFEVAIIDINLPSILDIAISGWDLVRIFRSIDPAMSMIVVSGEDGVEDRACRSHVAFLRKPIMLSQLKAMIKAVSSYQQSEANLRQPN